MLADVHELVRSSLTNAIQDQKVTSDARAQERAALRAALKVAGDRPSAPDEQLQKHLVAADKALEAEQLGDDQATGLLGHSVPSALVKLAELAGP